MAGLVTSNLGVSLVPELTVPYFDPKQVAIVELAAPDLNRPVYVCDTGRKDIVKSRAGVRPPAGPQRAAHNQNSRARQGKKVTCPADRPAKSQRSGSDVVTAVDRQVLSDNVRRGIR